MTHAQLRWGKLIASGGSRWEWRGPQVQEDVAVYSEFCCYTLNDDKVKNPERYGTWTDLFYPPGHTGSAADTRGEQCAQGLLQRIL